MAGPFRLYKQTESDRQRSATYGRVRALGELPVSATPPTITVQAGNSLISGATSTITGTLYTARWTASTFYPIGSVILDPVDYIKKWQRTASGTSGAVFDATEQAKWTVVPDSTKVLNPFRWNATYLRWGQGNAADATGQGFLPRSPAQTNGNETATYAFQPTQWTLDFDWYTAAGAFEVCIWARTQVRVVIDGQYASATPTNATTVADYAWKFVKVSGVAAGYHRVRLEFGADAMVAGVKLATADVAFPPALPLSSSFAILGDSYIEGATDVSGTTTADIRGYGYRVGQMLGFSDYLGLGIAGTGYTLSATAPYSSRIADLVALQPDYVLIQGSLNDFGAGQTAVAAAVAAFVATLQAANLPKTRVLFSGCPFYGTSTNLQTYNGWIKPAITAAGYGFIDTDGWGPGPAVFTGADNVHPTALGHEYIARRMSAELAKRWALPV